MDIETSKTVTHTIEITQEELGTLNEMLGIYERDILNRLPGDTAVQDQRDIIVEVRKAVQDGWR
jgi:hypothetical protein